MCVLDTNANMNLYQEVNFIGGHYRIIGFGLSHKGVERCQIFKTPSGGMPTNQKTILLPESNALITQLRI